jgi:hypothetical protein
MGFFRCILQARKHEFERKKKQGKNRVMQRHEQVLPPAAASRESMQGIKYKRSDRVPMGAGR